MKSKKVATKPREKEGQSDILQRLLLRQAWYEQQLHVDRKASNKIHELTTIDKLRLLAEKKHLKKLHPSEVITNDEKGTEQVPDEMIKQSMAIPKNKKTPLAELQKVEPKVCLPTKQRSEETDEVTTANIPTQAGQDIKEEPVEIRVTPIRRRQEKLVESLSNHLKQLEEQELALIQRVEEALVKDTKVPTKVTLSKHKQVQEVDGDKDELCANKLTVLDKSIPNPMENQEHRPSHAANNHIKQLALPVSIVQSIYHQRGLYSEYLYKAVGSQSPDTVDPWGIMDRYVCCLF
jgi:hypothetical protein